jgi:hypothetical protein
MELQAQQIKYCADDIIEISQISGMEKDIADLLTKEGRLIHQKYLDNFNSTQKRLKHHLDKDENQTPIDLSSKRKRRY